MGSIALSEDRGPRGASPSVAGGTLRDSGPCSAHRRARSSSVGHSRFLQLRALLAAAVFAVVAVSIVLAAPRALAAGWTLSNAGLSVLEDVSFVDASTGWATGATGTYKTTNGGSNWTLVDPNGGYAVCFASSLIGWVSSDSIAGQGPAIRRTANGGSSWTSTDVVYYTHGFDAASTTRMWAVGEQESRYVSTNGTSYTLVASGKGAYLEAVDFASTSIGWAVGDGGLIYKCTDGTTTWAAQTSGTTANLKGVSAPSTTVAYACGDDGRVLKTTNGGTTWTSQTTPVSTALNDIHFVNTTNGWAVGSEGTILYTGNGGTTWTKQESGTTIDLLAVHFYDVSTGWAVGAGGTVVRTTTGGGTTPSIATLTSSTHPDPDTWYSSNSLTTAWTSSDEGGTTGYSYTLDQASATTPDTASEGTGTSFSYNGAADGVWYFHVRALNAAGWGAATHRRLRIDTTAPSAVSGLASSTHASQTTWYANNTPALTWTASTDATSEIAGYSYVLDKTAGTVPDTTVDGTATSKTYTAQSDGLCYFHVRAVDKAGNGGATSHYTIRIDTTAPGAINSLASSTHASQTTWYTNNTPAFTWAASSDATSGIAGYSFAIDTTSGMVPDTTVDGTATSKTYTAQADGTRYFHIRSVDAAGNGGTTNHYVVKIDTTGPGAVGSLASSTHASQTTWYANNDPAFSWTAATDAGCGVAGYSYVLDQTSGTTPDATAEGTGLTASFTDKADGTWYFHVRAVDNLGTGGTTSHYTVKIDATVPGTVGSLGSSTHASQTTWYASNDPAFSWTAATDATSGIKGYSYVLDQTSGTTPDTTTEGTGLTASFTDKADGTWYFHIRSVDNAGSGGTTSHYTVKIDATVPGTVGSLASSTHASQTAWYAANDPAFSWTAATDATSGIKGYSYVLDQTSGTTPDTTTEGTGLTASFTDKADGTWYFHVRAVDNAGSGGTTSHYTVMIDVAAPGAINSLTAPNHPSQTTWYTNTTMTFNWAASTDATSGIAGYSYALDYSASTVPDTTVDTTGLTKGYLSQADAVRYFHIRAIDGAGNGGATSHYCVRIDTNAPLAVGSLASSTHASQTAWYASNDPALSWTAPNDTTWGPSSGIAGYSYVLDQTSGTTPDGTTEGTGLSVSFTDKADGTWYFHVRGVDNVALAGTVSQYTIKIDTTAPGAVSGLASSTHASQTTWYANNDPAFSWTAASDATSGVAGYSYVLDQTAGTTPDTTADGTDVAASFTDKADGTWYFHIRSVDNAGNGGTASHYTVKIDTTGPGTVGSLASSTHASQTTWYTSNDPAFSWTAATDAGCGVAGYSYVLDQVSNTTPDTTSEGAGLTAAFTNKADGTWYFHVRSVDSLGNAGTTSHYTVKVDTTAPGAMVSLASSTHASQTTWYANNDPAFSWSASADTSSGVAGYSYVLDQTAGTTPDTASEGAGLAASFTDKADGTWYLHVRSVDAAGLAGATSHYTVKIDTTAPGVMNSLASSTHASQTTWYANNDPAFSWTASTDATSGIAGYSYVLDQTAGTTPDTASEGAGLAASFTDKADGTWYLHVRSVDAAGLAGTTSHYTVKIDVTAPGAMNSLASSTHASQTTWYTDNTPAFTWTASADVTSGVAGYSYAIDTSAGTVPDATSEGSALSKTYTAQADGTRYFHVRAIDAAGNGGATSHYTIKIDTTGPAVVGSLASSTHASETTWYTNNTPAFDWSASSDAGSGVAGYSYVIDQTSDTTPDATTEGSGLAASFTDKADGTWYFHVRAVDSLGTGGATSHYTIKIDTTGPAAVGGLASSTHASETTWHTNNTPAFDWSASSDAGSGTAGYSYVLDQAPDTTPDSTSEGSDLAKAYAALEDGLYYFHVRAVDSLGNGGATSHYAVRVDTAAPATTDDAPSARQNSPVMVHFAGDDAHAGVAHTFYTVNGGLAQEGTSVEVSADGVTQLTYWSVDGAGNVESAHSVSVELGLIGSLHIENGASSTVVDRVLLYSAVDGATQMRFSNDGETWSEWEAYAPVKVWNLTSAAGEKTVAAQYGNGTYSLATDDTIALDATRPGGMVQINNGASSTTDLAVTLSNEVTGATEMRFRDAGGAWSEWEAFAATKSWVLPSGGEPTKTVEAEFRDVELDLLQSSDSILVDSGAPSGTMTVAGGERYSNETTVTLGMNVTGATEMRFRNAGGAWSDWEPYTASKSWTMAGADGLKLVEGQFRDAQLQELHCPDAVTLDTHAPDAPTEVTASWVRLSGNTGRVNCRYKGTEDQPLSGLVATATVKTSGGVTRKTATYVGESLDTLISRSISSTLTKGSYRLVVNMTDEAGNAAPAAATVSFSVR